MKQSTDETFNDIIQSEETVIVDFWADWCGPCKALAPLLEQVDGIEVYKHNIEEQPQTAPQYRVRSIPTLVAFRKGNVVGMKTGSMSKGDLDMFVKGVL